MKFQKKVDDQMLWQQLFKVGDDVAARENADSKAKVKAIILQYLGA